MLVRLFALALLSSAAYAEISLGNFTTRAHGLTGEVVLLSENRIAVKGFTYDGEGPGAHFWLDEGSTPSDDGLRLLDGYPSGTCGTEPLPAANGTLTYQVGLPSGTTISDYLGGSFSVWCEVAAANFGEVAIPASLDVSRLTATSDESTFECDSPATSEISLGKLTERIHDVTGTVFILSDRLIEIRGFTYDGLGPAAYWWADTSATPSDNGFILQDSSPSNSCGSKPLPSADGTSSYRVEFPEGKTIFDIQGGSISVWCEEFSANFGEVVVPTLSSDIVAAADGPPLECSGNSETSEIVKTPAGYNCEPLNDEFQVRWVVDGSNLAIELVGIVSETDYMAFGVSGSSERTFMIGADVVVADSFGGEFRANDYSMNDRSQCSGEQGVCPDTVVNGTNDVSDVSGVRESGITLIRYNKSLNSSDVSNGETNIDQPVMITPGVSTYVVWALGPVSPDTGYPQFHATWSKENVQLEFGRDTVDNCSPLSVEVATEAPIADPFEIPILQGVTEFTARIGPSGRERGYKGITGMTSWGIAWYINDLLVPVIEMRRGTEYTFRVSGGDDDGSNAVYHPFYITSGKVGGYFQLSPSERAAEKVFAGINVTEQTDEGIVGFVSTVEGPICEYIETSSTDAVASSGDYDDYFATLDTSCKNNSTITGAAAVLTFTPDETTPDEIYYQCVTHRNLGWKIAVLDADAPPLTPMPNPVPASAPVAAPTGATSAGHQSTGSGSMFLALSVLLSWFIVG